MKKYSVYFSAFAGASYKVVAENEEDAIEKANKLQNLDDCTASDWDFEAEPDVQVIE